MKALWKCRDRTSNPTGIGDVTKTSRMREYLSCILEENKSKGEEGVLASCCSVTKLCPTLCDPRDCSTSRSPVLHCFPEFAQTHVHWVGDAIQPSHPLASPSPPALDLSQHQGLFQWVVCSYQVTNTPKLQLLHQSFQWIFRVDLLKIDWFDLLAVQGTLRSLL